jgi:mannose-6-phosphate isomerase
MSRAGRARPTAEPIASAPVQPVVLEPNRIRRFYAGGPRIDDLRGEASRGSGAPEDWVGSTTTSFGDPREGLSVLADGRLLRDAIESEPVAFLGADHVARWGANPALLVKLLDAGERLPVHFHPGRAFASEQLGLSFGKTEAWIIVAAQPDAVVHLGLRAPVSAATVRRWVGEQDVAVMLAAMNEVPVAAGQILFVPAGTPHSIGSGILLVELQEPTDLSILLEWQRLRISSGVEHLALGWERALAALSLDAHRPGLGSLPEQDGGPPGPLEDLLPESAEPYFRAQSIMLRGSPVGLEPSFSILIVLDGELSLTGERGGELELRRGATVLIPHGSGGTRLDGQATVIRCRPPAPEAGSGRW